jgi:hypothetical protein
MAMTTQRWMSSQIVTGPLGARAVRVKGSLLDFALRVRIWLQPEPGGSSDRASPPRGIQDPPRPSHRKRPDRLPVLELQVKSRSVW